MNEVIELHDSELDEMNIDGSTAVLWLRPAYVHRSFGRPGVDAGSGWTQDATITITEASFSAPVIFPATVLDGEVRIGNEILQNSIPTKGRFSGPVTIELLLSPDQTLIVRGSSLTIDVHGEASYVEDFVT